METRFKQLETAILELEQAKLKIVEDIQRKALFTLRVTSLIGAALAGIIAFAF